MLKKRGKYIPSTKVNVAEFKSREEMHKVITNLKANMKSVFPESRSFVSM